MKKILGLDLGTNSIGWALVGTDENGKPNKIEGMGSRIIPMGTDKQDYEKGVGITKNAERREKRSSRKMNKRYKLRRNKLLFMLNELGMLPEQFQFKNGIPEATKIQDLELLPIKKGTLQLDSIQHYKLRANSLENPISLKEIGKVIYSFNQLRGYSGGNNDEKNNKKEEENNEENESFKSYEVITQKVIIKDVEQSNIKFKGRGKNKDQEFNKYNVVILFNDEEIEGETELQNLFEKINQEEELEIRIRRNKKGEKTSVVFALPQKTNWRKQMEKTEKDLKESNLYISQLILRDLGQNKWTKIKNRVFLRHRYQAEFDVFWDTQSKTYEFLNNCPQETLEKIANYIFPGKSETQKRLRQDAIKNGLKYIIKEQVIYYQRPLKPQTELISNCRFEKDEKVIATSNPLFQEFRCWKQINNLYITTKQEVYNEKKKRNIYKYKDYFLTNEEKQEIYEKLQTQKQIGFSEVAKIVKLKNDKTEYLNGLNVKAKLIGCDTQIVIKKILGEHYDKLYSEDYNIVEKIWKVIFDNVNNGSEYDPQSPKVLSIKEKLFPLNDNIISTELALKLAQNVKFPRKYSNFSKKAIENILPLMQLNPINIPEKVKKNFSVIQNLIETGEVLDENLLEDYVISFIQNNPNVLEKGGVMESFAISLVYGKHTLEEVSPQFKDYHEIQRVERNLRNPIVEQLTNETMQVIKAIWKQYKINPEELEIRVELARDLKNSAKERDAIFKGQIKSQKTNERIKKKLSENNIDLTDRNILKYKLYEQQKFMSPYTKHIIIPFSELFDDKLYDIDHIIPKSRYFDNSISNLVVCETNINEEKNNRTAWEYISQQNSKFNILSIDTYLSHINENFYGKKKKNLLLEKIPTNLVERQLKNTQYISIAVKNELAKIVGSENIKTSTGEVTSFLRSRWGLNDLFMRLTQDRFKQMELWDINKETGKPYEEWVKVEFDEKKNKNILKIKNWSKRYDHRHHSIDALVVALTEQSHIQRLNNLNKYLQDELTTRQDEFKLKVKEDETILEVFFNLEENRRKEIQNKIESSRYFEKPFDDLIKQVSNLLETMIVSIKPKDKLGIAKDKKDNNTPDKELKPQLKIRGGLHEETNYGKTRDPKTGMLRDTKTLNLSKISTKDIPQIIDEVLKKEINNHRIKYDSIKEAFTGEGLKTFNESRFQTKKTNELKPPVYKVKVWYSNKPTEDSSLQRLYDHNPKQSVITGDNYLFIVMEKAGKRIFDIASLYDSADIAKRALKDNIENYKQSICEDFRIKHKDKPEKVLFTLQQNDLVYLPKNNDDLVQNLNNDELKERLSIIDNKIEFCKRVFKVVKFTGKDCYFIPHNFANVIVMKKDLTEEQLNEIKIRNKGKKSIPKSELNYVEFGSYRDCSPYDSLHKENEKVKIQDRCIKLRTDWIGNIYF